MALSAFTRDEQRYQNPGDHDATGLFRGGPKGEQNPLTRVQGFQYCAISAATPENERHQRVVYRGREKAELRDELSPPAPRLSVVGRFLCPTKPAASGRRKKVAA